MPGIIVVGLQWGDEGKGKVVDMLSARASHIVRSQGGNNAGHTVIANGKEIALHLLPSGILHPHVQCYIAGGCLIDPKVLLEEIKRAEEGGIALMERLSISPHAHIILPVHKMLDRLKEEEKGEHAIGTTGRGIGPCASDRSSRVGLRMAELIRPDVFGEKLELFCASKNKELEKIYGHKPLDISAIYDEYSVYGELLRPFVSDVEGHLTDALLRDETVLLEGAHGTLLDTTFGSYPFVTSSSTLASGVCAGAAIGPVYVDEVLGVLKAYTTRVGSGPLPTTIDPDTLEDFRGMEDLREVGTTTGRERRIGWLDLVLAKHACRMNGVTQLVLTKLDVLDTLEEICVCVGYSLDGETLDSPPALLEDLERVEPIYETMPGWMTSTKQAEKIRQLPENARAYIDRIEDFCNISIGMVSVGPDRKETIQIDEEWM
ncbi:MAG: adenylosuccinate synthase [Simkaniaceae bacterium]|nr:adenylosuccinate synthase [Candidatus Sacchlamyda saccharinae]